MRIRATQLLQLESFPEQKAWIGKLISPINDFINQSVRIINNGLTFKDNEVGVDHTFSFTYESDAITLPIEFLWTQVAKPLSLILISAFEDDVAFIPAVAWQYTQDTHVQLTRILRFTASAPTAIASAYTTLGATVGGAAVAACATLAAAPAVSLLNVGSKYRIRVRVTP